MDPQALAGVKVLEMGQLVAGPFACSLLAQFGAEVTKLEPPGGDPIRGWRGLSGGTSLWWRQMSRNKHCRVVDLRTDAGQALARKLAAESDVVVENFRPGTLERWGMAPDRLREHNPGLIVARVTGYGQTGPRRDQPGFAAVCEAWAGLRHLIGEPGQLPVRPNLSLGDTITGLHAALGILLALRHRDRTGVGQDVDVSIVESVLSMMESVIPEYDRLGVVRGPSGVTVTGIVPTGLYRAADGIPIVLGANGQSIFARLCEVMGMPEWATDPRFATNAARIDNQDTLEAAIGEWISGRTAAAAIAALEAAEVPCSAIRTAADVAEDEHLAARDAFEVVEVDGQPVKMLAPVPRLSLTPGRTLWCGPDLDEHPL